MNDIEFALQVSVLGFTMVIFTLFFLYLVLLLFGRIFDDKDIKAPLEDSLLVNLNEDDYLSGSKKAAISAALYLFFDKDSDYIITRIEPESSPKKWLIEGRKKLHGMNAEIDRIRREKDGKKIF